MRKKKIIEQNLMLFKQLDEAREEINSLKAELKEKNDDLKNLKSKEEKPVSEPLKVLEEKVTKKKENLPEDMLIASEIIGKIVIESARYSNILTADGETKYKELVNLILGKTEVAKSEILAITNEDVSLEKKKEEMTLVFDNVVDYFEIVMAQKQ